MSTCCDDQSAGTIPTMPHTPGSRVPYSWDWTPAARVDAAPGATNWLDVGETIVEVSTTVTGETGITVESPYNFTPAGMVTAWVTATQSGLVTCNITTSLGKTQSRSIYLEVAPR